LNVRTTTPFPGAHRLGEAIPVRTNARIRPWLAAGVMLAGLAASVLIALWIG
jgi:hypothetical protein